MSKTNPGNFFEDFAVGQVIEHATPRTVTEGDRAVYQSLYPTRFAIPSSAAFAASVGMDPHPVEDLIAFHIAFGKTVPDISLNAVANLGYAECRFLRPVIPGDTLHQFRGDRDQGKLQRQERGGLRPLDRRQPTRRTGPRMGPVGHGPQARSGRAHPRPGDPELSQVVAPTDLVLPEGLAFESYDFGAAGEPHRYSDYEVGEKIDHVDGVTLTDPEHMMATRLWQNTAKIHFNTQARPDGRRLIYGGHIISLARALSFNGFGQRSARVGDQRGAHTAPAFADDTVYAWSEILDKADTPAPGLAPCGSDWSRPAIGTSR